MKHTLRNIIFSAMVAGALLPHPIYAASTGTSGVEAELKELLEMTRSEMNAYKTQTLKQVMALTEGEANKFWPIYESYDADLRPLQDRNVQLIRDFLELSASGETADKEWNSVAKQWLKNKGAQLQLWEKYQKQISKKVSGYRAAQFLQVENQMRLFLDLSIANEMPIITTVSRKELLPEPAVPTREESLLVSITASVESIDQAKREVTLKGALGNETTFVVDDRVKRLNEVQVGDLVRADYYVSVAGELRAPTAEEEASPLVIKEGAGRVPPGGQPAGGALRLIKAVCTIEGLNRPEQTVTLQGPLGRLLTVRAAAPENLPNLRIGDTVVVTYTEALAISLEKVKGNEN